MAFFTPSVIMHRDIPYDIIVEYCINNVNSKRDEQAAILQLPHPLIDF